MATVEDGVYRDIDGAAVDAPIIPEFEQRILEASARADEAEIQEIQADYEKARAKRQETLNKRARAARREAAA